MKVKNVVKFQFTFLYYLIIVRKQRKYERKTAFEKKHYNRWGRNYIFIENSKNSFLRTLLPKISLH